MPGAQAPRRSARRGTRRRLPRASRPSATARHSARGCAGCRAASGVVDASLVPTYARAAVAQEDVQASRRAVVEAMLLAQLRARGAPRARARAARAPCPRWCPGARRRRRCHVRAVRCPRRGPRWRRASGVMRSGRGGRMGAEQVEGTEADEEIAGEDGALAPRARAELPREGREPCRPRGLRRGGCRDRCRGPGRGAARARSAAASASKPARQPATRQASGAPGAWRTGAAPAS